MRDNVPTRDHLEVVAAGLVALALSIVWSSQLIVAYWFTHVIVRLAIGGW